MFFVPSYLHQITVYMWKILVLQIKNMQVATSVKLQLDKSKLSVWGGLCFHFTVGSVRRTFKYKATQCYGPCI